ncbi:cytochrome P450 family protein [Ceratobasidium sp. AG-Ba]|nr:cytochrome P450 family protein [Ceratobasidium sp. AG-Ba]
MSEAAIVCLVGAFAALFAYRLARVGKREADLPNGPPTLPIVGNLHVFPKTQAHLKFTEWARLYGGIYSLKLGHLTALVITDMEVLKELMEKRSQVTIDRPFMYGVDLVTGGMHMALAKSGDMWRIQRRIVQETLTPRACEKHLRIQQAESIQLVHDCLHNPKHYSDHMGRYSFSIILSIMFGKRASRPGTQEMVDFFEMEEHWQKVLTPGSIPPVEILPLLKYLPRFMAPWKDYCDKTRNLQHKLYCGWLHETKSRVAQGLENGSFMEQILLHQVKHGMNDLQTAYLGGTMIEAGGDTTTAWLKFLVLALIAYPEVQEKAYEEINRTVGRQRMPNLEDLSQLPYTQAIIKEVHRWRPVGPLAVPHANTKEIEYGGYRIPAGTTIFINTWGISHDPDVYDRPEDFWPDRWLLHEFGAKPGTKHAVNPPWFGTGRRICPGSLLASNGLAITTMNLLWSFTFAPAVDAKTGNPVAVNVLDVVEGLAIRPEPFECRITPRSKHHANLIQQEFVATQAVLEAYEHNS